MGSDIPKPFIEISGKSILERSIECFLNIEGMSQIVVATSSNHLDDCHDIVSKFDSSVISFEIVEGGLERQDSIWNALRVINDEIELIAIHDAARPFAELDKIILCFKAANEFGGAVLGVLAKDTIKQVDESEFIKQTPERVFLWQAQTPQIFKKHLIKEAYRSAIEDKFLGTDDASLVERIGGTVKMIEGNRENFKITYSIDLQVAELIIKNRS